MIECCLPPCDLSRWVYAHEITEKNRAEDMTAPQYLTSGQAFAVGWRAELAPGRPESDQAVVAWQDRCRRRLDRFAQKDALRDAAERAAGRDAAEAELAAAKGEFDAIEAALCQAVPTTLAGTVAILRWYFAIEHREVLDPEPTGRDRAAAIALQALDRLAAA